MCDCCGFGGDSIFMFKMVEFFNGVLQLFNLIVQGIDDVYFVYGVDMDGNGLFDCYVVNLGIDNSVVCIIVSGYNWIVFVVMNWSNVIVVCINVFVCMLSVLLGWIDMWFYDMGCGMFIVFFNDGYK